jgi:hypothetical protein
LAIDKAMTPLEDEGGEAVSVDLGEPTSTTDLPDGGAVISFGEDLVHDVAFDDNLAEHMGPRALAALSSELLACVEADRMSRQDWERTYMQGLDLLGLRAEDRSTPWPGACGVFHPILAEAAVRFQASSIMEVWPATGPAKVAVVGKVDDKKQRQAERVQADLNYFLTEVMTEARSEHERLLWALPLAGAAFKKTYYDPTLGRPVSMFVPAEDFIIPYGATDLQSAPRYTHTLKRYGNEIRKLQVAGFYRDIDLPEPTADYSDIEKKRDQLSGDSPSVDYDDRHTLLEVHAELDLEGFEDPDGIALPYVVTIDKSSSLVLAVRRNWAEDDLRKAKRTWFTQYTYIPGWGIYGLGLIHLIGGIAKSSTSILRQLVDAGTLSNLPAGLKSRGLRIKGDSSPLMPGEFRDVDVPSGSIRDAITFLPFKEPSQVLAGLLNQLVEEGRRFASIADLEIGDGNQQAPVGTTLALMERAMKVMSAVQARLHASMHGELKLLTELIHENAPRQYEYEVDEGATRAEDYDGRIDVLPVSDPNATTMSQRVMQYQAALQLSAQAPQMYDMPELHRQMLGVLGLKDIGKIIPSSEEKKPMDPVAENMAVLTGKPVKAFLYQDHEAHIKVTWRRCRTPRSCSSWGRTRTPPASWPPPGPHHRAHRHGLPPGDRRPDGRGVARRRHADSGGDRGPAVSAGRGGRGSGAAEEHRGAPGGGQPEGPAGPAGADAAAGAATEGRRAAAQAGQGPGGRGRGRRPAAAGRPPGRAAAAGGARADCLPGTADRDPPRRRERPRPQRAGSAAARGRGEAGRRHRQVPRGAAGQARRDCREAARHGRRAGRPHRREPGPE